MGIRPECMFDDEASLEKYKNSTIDAHVDLVEMMGSETYLYLLCQGKNFTARVSARSTARTGDDLKRIEARLREVQPLIKNIANYRKLKPVYDAYMKAKDKSAFRAKHEAELVIFEAAKTTLLAMQGDQKLPSLKALQAEQQRITDEQQRLYDERARLKREMKQIDTIKTNVDMLLRIGDEQEQTQQRFSQRE